jgi:hypothetical protein
MSQPGYAEGDRFGLFIVSRPDTNIQQVEVDKNPIITEKDIVEYHWKTHTIILSEEGLSKFPSGNKYFGKPFIIVADGHRCYMGAFWSKILSANYSRPVIDITSKTKIIRIEQAYPTAKFAKGDDPRNNQFIYKVFSDLGKLKK